MISPEIRAQIRRYFYAEHWKVGTIASELGVHPDAVRNAIESERFMGAPRRYFVNGAFGCLFNIEQTCGGPGRIT